MKLLVGFVKVSKIKYLWTLPNMCRGRLLNIITPPTNVLHALLPTSIHVRSKWAKAAKAMLQEINVLCLELLFLLFYNCAAVRNHFIELVLVWHHQSISPLFYFLNLHQPLHGYYFSILLFLFSTQLRRRAYNNKIFIFFSF